MKRAGPSSFTGAVKRRRRSDNNDEDDDTPPTRDDLSTQNITDGLIKCYAGWYHGVYRALVKRDLPHDAKTLRAHLLKPRGVFADEHIADDGYPTPELVRRAVRWYASRMRYARRDSYYDEIFNPKID